MSTGPHHQPSLYSDDPRDGSVERPDELGREEFAAYLGHIVESVRSQSESSVLALIGDWGSGKTSILELLRKHLTSEVASTWLLAEFNPWTYPDATSLQRGFFSELTGALPKNDRPSGARAKLGELARSISPVGKLGGLVGVDAEGAIQSIADLVVGDTSASAAKRSAETALRRIKRPVLMVIDDLDRLTPVELLEVLKLVRLVGRLPHVYYLLAYDERTLLDILGDTAIAGSDEMRARAYLEKIVQVRLDMPALRESQRTSLLNQGLDSILRTNDVSLTETDTQRLRDIYFAVLDRRLETPRAITRFLGQVQAFFGPLRGEVDFVDFLLVSWLRTQEPGVYAMLRRERAALLGRDWAGWSFVQPDAAAIKEKQELWESRLADARVNSSHMDGVIRVLSELFPAFHTAFAGLHFLASEDKRSTPKAISDPDYFDRYLSFGVPIEDLPDAIVVEALRDLAGSYKTRSLQRLSEELRNNTFLAVRKIDAVRESGVSLPEGAIFSLLAQACAEISHEGNGTFVAPNDAAQRAAARCLISMDSEEALASASRVATQQDGAQFVVKVVRTLYSNKQSRYASLVPSDYDLTPLGELAISAIKYLHNTYPSPSPLDEEAMSNFWAWLDFDPTNAYRWLQEKVSSGTWTLKDTLGALTSVAVSMGPDKETSIGDFDLKIAEKIFGLDTIFDHLSSDLDAAQQPRGDTFRIPATPENRTQYALNVLRHARAERTLNPVQDDE